MMHAIEHVSDPYSTWKEIYPILKPGGIFVMETPRYDTLMFKLLGKRERSLSCDGHIYFFTTNIMSDRLTIVSRPGGFLRLSIIGRYYR